MPENYKKSYFWWFIQNILMDGNSQQMGNAFPGSSIVLCIYLFSCCWCLLFVVAVVVGRDDSTGMRRQILAASRKLFFPSWENKGCNGWPVWRATEAPNAFHGPFHQREYIHWQHRAIFYQNDISEWAWHLISDTLWHAHARTLF